MWRQRYDQVISPSWRPGVISHLISKKNEGGYLTIGVLILSPLYPLHIPCIFNLTSSKRINHLGDNE